MFLKVGLLAIVIRVALFALLGGEPGAHILVRLPIVPLPSWMAGVRLGGPITLEGVLAAAYDGMRLGVIFCCIGAANSLTSPRRLLKSLPGALYEAGVAITVALAFAPQAVAAVGRLRSARRLRGRADKGLRRAARPGDPGARGRPRALGRPGRRDGRAWLRPARLDSGPDSGARPPR